MNFSIAFNQQEFSDWIEKFLPDFSMDVRKVDVFNGVKSITTLGQSALGVRVFIIETEKDPTGRKVGLAKESFNFIKKHATPNALIAYYSDDYPKWRLSLLTSKPEWSEGKIITKLSNPKRQSYVLGPQAKVNTPTRFLLKRETVTDINDLKSRFSLEVVNKEFYKEISESFIKLVGGTLGTGRNQKKYDSKLKLPFIADHSQTSLEFAVRLIGRIIFCWFLREKKSADGTSLMPKELVSLEAISQHSDYYHAVLEPIFFEVLNQQIKSRKDPFYDEPYSLIPYLNGGLFSPHDDDFYKRKNGDLQSQFHNTLIIPDEWFVELFQTLETYHFTIDENTSFDEELSIDPEMLGRIFENLLAEINPETGESARKSTGSYYTPRVIVDYMVDESLLLYLKQKTGIEEDKLRLIISYDLTDDDQCTLEEDEKEKVINALEKIKILDPACGSGAFPIGALQKMVFILQQVDPEGHLWFKKQIQYTSPEIRRVLEREFAHKNFDYIRKLGVIRENIYGIDIQPIATEISRLRCFLTLVVDERIDDSLDNRGIEPLPNLDFKFVTANSLMSLPKLQAQDELFDDNTQIEKLRELRDQYFTARDEERKDLMLAFSDLQSEMINDLIDKHSWTGVAKAELTRKLTDWKPFKHKSTEWFDPEWMFGIKEGFDVVIANPPYVDSESMAKNSPEEREQYKEAFTTTKGNWDLFVPFIEKGVGLLRELGHLSYIIPNKLIAAKYAISLRELISSRTVCEVRDYSRLPVFIEADVYPVTIVAMNSSPSPSIQSTFTTMGELENVRFKNKSSSASIKNHAYWDIFFYDVKTFELLMKILSYEKLKQVGISILGAATVSEAYRLKEVIKDSNSEKAVSKIINTGTINKYQSLWGAQEMQYLKNKYLFPVVSDDNLQAINATRLSQAKSKKIIIAGMSKEIEAYYDINGEYLAGKSTSIILGQPETLWVILGILNSTLIDFFINKYFNSLKMSGGYINISKEILENIPLAVTRNDKLLQLVREMSVSPKVETKQKIDELVYKLYELTEDEIKIVEEET
ncbi:MAG: TaqI-like C-terminal specificity domain-containing protein [Methanolobus sp.]|nr:TaqI-like C-terminal specificity domain-containing protein [Methanolobus sp.]